MECIEKIYLKKNNTKKYRKIFCLHVQAIDCQNCTLTVKFNTPLLSFYVVSVLILL